MFRFGDRASEVCLNGTRDTLYFIKDHVWRMDVRSESLPEKPFLENMTGNYWYGLTVDPGLPRSIWPMRSITCSPAGFSVTRPGASCSTVFKSASSPGLSVLNDDRYEPTV